MSEYPQEIMAVRNRLLDAVRTYDVQALADLYADDYRGVGCHAEVFTKGELLARTEKPPEELKLETVEADEEELRLLGDVAIWTGRISLRGEYRGQPYQDSSLATLVAVKKNGRWQITASHDTIETPRQPAAQRDMSVQPLAQRDMPMQPRCWRTT